MDWPSTILIPAEKGWYRGKGLAGSMDNGDFMGFNGDGYNAIICWQPNNEPTIWGW